MVLDQVAYWNTKERSYNLSLKEVEARKKARKEFEKWVLIEVLWSQKPREVWLKDGDGNTRFFHKMANAHNRRNFLARI